jgi:hypothetical protein
MLPKAASSFPPIILPVGNQSNIKGVRQARRSGRNGVAKRRKTEKTVEIHEVYVIRQTSGPLPALCAECQTGDAIMVAPEHAAVITAVPVRAIYRWVETGMVHYKEATDGSLTVCVKSLPIGGAAQ